MALKQIKNKIKATVRTSKVTKAMEAVSAVKMRKSQERALEGRPYAESALRILERVSHAVESKQHPLFLENNSSRRCVIVITSDKGLAGSLNSSVLKEVNGLLHQCANDTVDFVCFGKKAFEHFTRRGFAVPLHYVNIQDEVTMNDVEEVVNFVSTTFRQQTYRTIHVVYQSFVSTFEQEAVLHEILPLKSSSLQEIVKGIVPKRGKYSDIHLETKPTAYTIEPNPSAVYETILPLLIKIMLYHALLESKASEHSARMVAMKNATDKAHEVTKLLTLEYNKKRQSIITAEVSEITGGMEVMKR